MSITAPTANGGLTVYPDGTTRPAAPTVHYVAGKRLITTTVTVALVDGRIDFYSSAGQVTVQADVVGYDTAAPPDRRHVATESA